MIYFTRRDLKLIYAFLYLWIVFEKRNLDEGWLDQKEIFLYLLVRRFEWETPEYSSEKEMEGGERVSGSLGKVLARKAWSLRSGLQNSQKLVWDTTSL